MQDFHGRYYHPSNARFWFYGDDEPEERLRLLGSYLDEFEARPVDSTVHLQPLLKVLSSACFTHKGEGFTSAIHWQTDYPDELRGC